MIEIIGKNGAGKSYLANKLYYLGFKRNVGYTTRPIREGEIDGIDYFFITKEKFEEYIVNNDFVEYKIRNGFYYGILKNNISNNTILVSGDTKKIEEITGYNILKLYVDCDLSIRYSRVLTRNDTTKNVFNRFHTENFSYLSDFNAIFIDNCFNGDASLDNIINIIINNDYNCKLTSNREFIRHKVDNFDVSKINNFNDKLLMLLKFEEYLLRKLFLEKKVLSDYITVKEYYDALFQFLNNNNINYKILDKELYVNINEEEYKFDYKIKKKVI